MKDRIPYDELPDDKTICKLAKLPLTSFLLPADDISNFRSNFAILLLHNVIGKLNFLKPFQKYVPKHIRHTHNEQMTWQINLGLVFANEACSEGMVDILEFMHQYIYKGKAKEQVVFGGDQLTCKRAVGVQRLRKTSIEKEQRLADILPTAED